MHFRNIVQSRLCNTSIVINCFKRLYMEIASPKRVQPEMLHVFLVALVSLVRIAWSLPHVFDEAVIHVGSANTDLSSFYKALAKKDLQSMPGLYAKLENDHEIVRADTRKLEAAKIPDSTKPLQRRIGSQLDKTLSKLHGLMPDLFAVERHNQIANLSEKYLPPTPNLKAHDHKKLMIIKSTKKHEEDDE